MDLKRPAFDTSVLIAESALRAGADGIVTLNRKHFERVAPDGLDVVEP